MIENNKTRLFFFSEDNGLLEEKITEFKKQFPHAQTLIRPKLEDIGIALSQQTIFENDVKDFVFEKFEGNTNELGDLIYEIGLNHINFICTTISSKEIKRTKLLTRIFSNVEYKLNKLNKVTKLGHIDDLIKKKNIKISEDMLDIAKKSLPPSSTIINEFFEYITIYTITKPLDQGSFSYLINCFSEKSNNTYKFFESFLMCKHNEWIGIINHQIKNTQDLSVFFKIFINQLFNFYNFLHMSKHMSLSEIKNKNCFLPFIFFNYQMIYTKNKTKIYPFISKFIIELFVFIEQKISDSNSNIADLKLFFLRNNINDFK